MPNSGSVCQCVSVSLHQKNSNVCVNTCMRCACRLVSFNIFMFFHRRDWFWILFPASAATVCATNESKRISMSIVLPNRQLTRQHSEFYSNSILLYFDANACLRYDIALRFLLFYFLLSRIEKPRTFEFGFCVRLSSILMRSIVSFGL